MANRKGHHFGHFKAYVLQLVQQAIAGKTYLNTREVVADILRYEQIVRAPASALPGLQLADTVVSSVFQSIERASPAYPMRPALHLKPIIAGKQFYSGGPNRRNNFGITLYPAKEVFCLLEDEQVSFFEAFGYDASWFRKR